MASYKCKTNVRFGFTIVELLVVIVVIGILASITIVSYTGISGRATAAVMQSDLSNAANQLRAYHALYGSYPTTLVNGCPTVPSADNTLCLKASPSNAFSYSSDGTNFSLVETNTNGMVYNVTNLTPVAAGSSVTYYTLTISAGANGTVNTAVNGSYSEGSTPTITATPNSGYLFNNWTGSSGCNNVTTASYAITMNGDKSCVANFAVDPWANWYPGLASTVLAGKHVYKTNLGTNYQFKTTNTSITAPQGATGLDASYPSAMSLVSPQAYPGVDFSAYPAQNACKAIGGRLPTVRELLAMYADKASYGNNFVADYYWSSTEYTSNYTYIVGFVNGNVDYNNKSAGDYERCVAD